MARVRYRDRSRVKERVHAVSTRQIIKYALLIFTACILSVMQSTFFKINGSPVGLTLIFVAATGIFFGERDGAILGLLGGIIIDSLAGGVIYTSPLVYMLVGYFCGLCIKRFLSRSLPSFLVYMLLVGLIKQAVNIFYFVMLSDSLNLMEILLGTLLPDYIAFVVFSPAVYLAAFVIFKIVSIEKRKRL